MYFSSYKQFTDQRLFTEQKNASSGEKLRVFNDKTWTYNEFWKGNEHRSDIVKRLVQWDVLVECKSNTCLIKWSFEKESRVPFFLPSFSFHSFSLYIYLAYLVVYFPGTSEQLLRQSPFIKASPHLEILQEKFRCFNRLLQCFSTPYFLYLYGRTYLSVLYLHRLTIR